MQQMRVALGLYSRTKHQNAPKSKTVQIVKKDGESVDVEVGFSSAPVTYGVPLFPPPGFLKPDGYRGEIELSGIATYLFGKKPDELVAEYEAMQLSWSQNHKYVSFARMLAKIAYSTVVAENGIEIFDGDAFVLPAIRGTKNDIGQWVGTLTKPFETHPETHRIVPGRGRDPRLLVVEVQLFAEFGTPSYGVILGRTVMDMK